MIHVRPLADGDDDAVRRLFRRTLALGSPVGFDLAGIERYESLCLDWYLAAGRAGAAVAVDGGEVVGYALVCTDQAAHGRAVRRAGAGLAAWVVPRLLSRRLTPSARRFWVRRGLDALELLRAGAHAPMPAHAHVNVADGVRSGVVARALVGHVDDVVRRAGLPGWFGEVNAPAGRRSRALERLGGTVVRRSPNRTLSYLCGRPVERLTVTWAA